jgi:hypothetical protein
MHLDKLLCDKQVIGSTPQGPESGVTTTSSTRPSVCAGFGRLPLVVSRDRYRHAQLGNGKCAVSSLVDETGKHMRLVVRSWNHFVFAFTAL